MSELPKDLESLLTGENAAYIDQIHARWCEDASSVSEDWQRVFGAMDPGGSSPSRQVEPDHRSIFHGSTSDTLLEVIGGCENHHRPRCTLCKMLEK